MMKVYDMVTYGVCEPEDTVRTLDFEGGCPASGAGARALHCRELELGLQSIEAAPAKPCRQNVPPFDAAELSDFLATLGD